MPLAIAMVLFTFYTDHWQHAEDKRGPLRANARMAGGVRCAAEPADSEAGQRVLDFGAGPGFVLALADIVGEAGQMRGAGWNARFVVDARARAAAPTGEYCWCSRSACTGGATARAS